ncbi:unnamed protein product [Phaedon cochleariae]|uniref:Kazal-like domain-containing protein n=1 Tax=Phaedon cochleariae TaxID=80249 RepID=A0A9P0DQJ3_PHACE|nr:unnamed protein product [Phaedon cochleariae]
MNAAIAINFRLLLVAHVISLFHQSLAGTCWSAMVRNGSGRCTELVHEKISKEDCCASRSVTTSWSADEFDSGTLFFWRVLGGGVRCFPCRDSCKDVVCDADKTCVMRKGAPKCVCSSKCKEGKVRPRGTVCGTDGRSYRNVCRLRKHACRKRSHSLTVAYKGMCQSSCDRISCPAEKHCLLDQNLMPHCAQCSRRCQSRPKRRQAVCGSDGVTHPSACHLKEKACRLGKAIPMAYKGPCKPKATCKKVRCRIGESCLKDRSTGSLRCVGCSMGCRPRHAMRAPLCATNNATYPTWCHMMQDACLKGYVLDTQYTGRCKPRVTKI